MQPVVDAFNLHARLEPVLSRMRISADVALFEPAEPSRIGGGRAGGHEDGFYHALIEARIPFEIVAEQNLRSEDLERFKVLVLPDAERMSKTQCELVRDFVRRGGGVVAAHRSSLDDEYGTPRANFGLGDVFGVDLTLPVRGPVKNNYAALTGDHPLSQGFDGAERVIGGTELIGVRAHPGTDVPFRFIPDYPDLPMEEVYPRAEPGPPAAVARLQSGGGRSVYFPFNVGALFWEALQPDHGRLIANGVRWALGAPERTTVRGTGLLDLALWEGDAELAVALVNLTNPMALKGPIRETVPVGPLEVSVAIPDPEHVRAHLLVADEEVDVRVCGDGQAEVTVPRIDLLEAVRFTWSPGGMR